MEYDYYKQKYKGYTIKLDREKDADLIKFLDDWPDGPKALITWSLRILKSFIMGGGK